MKRLPFVPSTLPNEHPQFYLMKLAVENGYQSIQDLLNAYEQKMPHHKGQTLSGYDTIIRNLTGLKPQIDFRDKDLYSSKRYFSTLLSPHTKICPLCCIEGTSPIKHGFVYSTRCEKHNIMLQDYCEYCSQGLEWTKLLLNGKCGYCGTEVPLMPMEHCPIEQHINNIGSCNFSDFIDDLCLAASYILRPMDIHPEIIVKTLIFNSADLFMRAYQLLTSSNCRHQWLSYIAKECEYDQFKLGEMVSTAPLVAFQQGLKSDLNNLTAQVPNVSSFAFIEEFGPQEFSYQSRWKTKDKTLEEHNLITRYKCAAPLLSKLLSCELDSIYMLSKRGLFPSLNTKKHSECTYFDLREVNNSLLKTFIHGKADIINYVSLEGFKTYLTHFGIKESSFIEALLELNVQTILTEGESPFFERLKIPIFSAFRAIKRVLINSETQKIEHETSQKLYSLSDIDMRALLFYKKIQPQKWQQVSAYYKVSDFESLEKEYFNLARYCKIRGLNFEKISSELASNNIPPIIGKSYYKSRYQVVRFIKTGTIYHPPKNQILNLEKSNLKIHQFFNKMMLSKNSK